MDWGSGLGTGNRRLGKSGNRGTQEKKKTKEGREASSVIPQEHVLWLYCRILFTGKARKRCVSFQNEKVKSFQTFSLLHL